MTGITDPLPPPTKCDNCNSPRVVLNKKTKRNQAQYFCRKCKASVYCHKGTYIPLGYMASAHTRYLRARAHEVFDPLWMHNLMTRNGAYAWLARQLGVTDHGAHIGRLSDDQLNKLIGKSARQYRKLLAKAATKKDTDNNDTIPHRKRRTYARKRGKARRYGY